MKKSWYWLHGEDPMSKIPKEEVTSHVLENYLPGSTLVLTAAIYYAKECEGRPEGNPVIIPLKVFLQEADSNHTNLIEKIQTVVKWAIRYTNTKVIQVPEERKELSDWKIELTCHLTNLRPSVFT